MIPVFSFFSSSFVSVNEEREEKAQDSLATQYYFFSIIASKKKKKKGFQDFCYPSFHLLCFSSLTKAIVKSKGEKERYKHLNAEFQRLARRDKKAFLTINAKK